ncbi:hypothetical protein WICMUC_003434 [Wickerhamomyces mucosus]|uniref:Protein kinase domain-containing protein n=1 Tax=Wickerhamomyces mucosus TaxID=1378264 RepID=A0A9P8PLE0_9ASCO|nr:hypothetical protein WICMUC_003434 [Wickerhamomyces mucosus]
MSTQSQSKSDDLGELLIIDKHYNELDPEVESYGADGGNLKTITIERDKSITIGRSQSNSLIITHPSISVVHCLIWNIQFDEHSIPLVYIKDESLNGTFLNGHNIGKGATYLLNHNDIITIKFGVSLRFQSAYGFDESNYGRSVIQQNCIATDFEKWKVNDRILGNGTFGNVFVCQNKGLRNKLYAVKIIKNVVNEVSFEPKILLKLNHVIYDAIILKSKLYIFEDLIAGGDLFSYLSNGTVLKPLPEFESLVITFQILIALDYLHSNNVVHRDLKLDNILLATPEPFTKIILADFGIAKSTSSTKRRMFTAVGTPEYCAPEVGFEYTKVPAHLRTSLLGSQTIRKGYDSRCDIWSLGIIVHILLSGISPFYGDGTEVSIIKNAKRGDLSFSAAQWKKVSLRSQLFVKCLLSVDVRKRFTVKECFNHEWIRRHNCELDAIYKKILTR